MNLYFLQTNESKGLEETITALKQVSDTHDLKNIGELITETENTTINDRDMLFQQAQVCFHMTTSYTSYSVLNHMFGRKQKIEHKKHCLPISVIQQEK